MIPHQMHRVTLRCPESVSTFRTRHLWGFVATNTPSPFLGTMPQSGHPLQGQGISDDMITTFPQRHS